jgi:ATP-dependent phosphoenolpyruvate carboxykinase
VTEGGEHPFAALVGDRGGLPLAAPADAAVAVADPAFVAVLAMGEEILPPVARLGPAQAAAWLLLAGGGEIDRDEAAAAEALAEALAKRGTPAYLLTAGRVGGSGEAPSREIPVDLVARVLDAAVAGDVDWERDPDFGYELPMELPGLAVEERRLLVPRFLYARTDRVYDYAAMVPAAQLERYARLDGVPGLATAIADAVAAPRRRRQ